MLVDLFGPEMMQACEKSIANALISVFVPLLPLIIGIVAVWLCRSVILGAIKRLTYKFSLVSGYSHRQAKKRAKFVGSLVDLFSSFIDIWR